jgi:hypothetical protein
MSLDDTSGSNYPQAQGWRIVAGRPDDAGYDPGPSDNSASQRAPQFLRKAEEVRRVAERVGDSEARRTLLQIAHHYERLAARIDGRAQADSSAAPTYKTSYAAD